MNKIVKNLKYCLDYLRYRLIILLAGDYSVIINCKVYDDIITYNKRKSNNNCFFNNLTVEPLESVIKKNVNEISALSRRGLTRTSSGAIVLSEIK